MYIEVRADYVRLVRLGATTMNRIHDRQNNRCHSARNPVIKPQSPQKGAEFDLQQLCVELDRIEAQKPNPSPSQNPEGDR